MNNRLTIEDKAYIQYKFARNGISPFKVALAIEYAEKHTTFRINRDTVQTLIWLYE